MNQSEAAAASLSALSTFYDGVTGLFTCNLMVSVPANVYVVWLIVSGAGGAVASELFALNLAACEIVFCVSSGYLMLHYLLRLAADVGLLLLQCVLNLMVISRPIFQSCICLERYLAVVHPTTFLRFKPLRYKLAFCVVSWLLMLLYCITPIFTFSAMQVVYQLIGKSLIFLVLMLYCGVHVLCVLGQPAPGDGDRAHGSRNMAKRKAFKVIMITLVFTSGTQLLQILMVVATLLFASYEVVLQITLVCLAVSIISGFITPLLYLHRAGKLPCVSKIDVAASPGT